MAEPAAKLRAMGRFLTACAFASLAIGLSVPAGAGSKQQRQQLQLQLQQERQERQQERQEARERDRGDRGDRDRDRDGKDSKDKDSDKADTQSSGGADQGSDQKKTGKKADGSGSRDKQDSADAEPPQTVAEMLRRWAKSGQKDDADKRDTSDKSADRSDKVPDKVPDKAADKAAVTPAGKAAAGGEASKTSPAGKIGPIVGLPAMQFGRPEFLASNFPPETLKRLAPGFQANGTTSLPTLGLAWTRILVPPAMSIDDARQYLQAAAPNASFDLNKEYRIFKPANAPQDTRLDESRPARPMPTSCGTDRCFATDITGWKREMSSCASGVKIGLIDTGYDEAHPALKDQRSIARRRIAKGAAAPNWHGTGVLALLAGNEATGTAGMVPKARFLAADIFYADADGQPASDTASLAEAIDWLAGNGVQIINMSLAGPADEILETAIERAYRRGIIFVAAAGNDGPTAPARYPAAYKQVIAVTAVGSALQNYRHAVRGDHIDLAAPGVEIWTAMPGNRAAYHSGTSFAAPYVTAIVASMHGSLREKTKERVLREIRKHDLGAPGRDPIFGEGLALAPLACGANVAVSATAEKPPMGFVAPAAVSKPVAGKSSFFPSGDR